MYEDVSKMCIDLQEQAFIAPLLQILNSCRVFLTWPVAADVFPAKKFPADKVTPVKRQFVLKVTATQNKTVCFRVCINSVPVFSSFKVVK